MAASISIVSASSPPWVYGRSLQTPRSPSASLSLFAGSRTRNNLSMNVATNSATRSSLLHCSFPSSSSLSSLYINSSESGLFFGLDLNSNIGNRKGPCRGLVVRAGKASLAQTRRSRSRKSLARTHGFRRRMRTPTGRAVLKRRRAKGRRVLCTKSYPNRGKNA